MGWHSPQQATELVAGFRDVVPRPNAPLASLRDGRSLPRKLIREQIKQSLTRALERRATLEQVMSVLRNPELEMVYQPAIRFDEPRVEFFEALARFRSVSCGGPEHWFAAAAEVGLSTDLEMLAVHGALQGLGTLPEGASVSINVSPSTIVSSDFAELIASAPLDRIILEITEQQAVDSYEATLTALKPLRERGLRVAVDDAGAGHSSFRHILQIRPDIIKLDMSICRGIHQDHVRRALASALVTFARQIGSELVAEGVETACELRSLRELGMLIIQGHIIARPMRLERIEVSETFEMHPSPAAAARHPLAQAALQL